MDEKSGNSVREVFLEAAEIADPENRAAYLDKACAGDESLRRRVEAILAAEAQAGGPPPEAPPPAQTLADPALGSRVGHYQLLQQIGEGGCGVVFMADQQQPVRRKVALKVIKLGMDTKQVVARFEAERQALAMMDHPNIAQVFEAGATESGRPYFVMELVRGIKITDYCDQHQFSTRQRLDLFVQVCHAVQHAHHKGIIHRDLKPSNILVTELDGVPLPKIIDFGIAKAVEGRLTDQTLFTAFEHFIGTPAYMSPEQAALTAADIDTRSDIYSLGVLLYELLTGKTPFETKALLASGLDAMRQTIREKEPLRPSNRLHTLSGQEKTTTARSRGTEVLRLIHLIRGDLDWIVMKCLEKDRKRRYETANGLAEDVRRHLDNEPVLARPPSRLYEFRKSVQRHKVGFAAAATVILVLVAGVLVSAWQTARARRAERAQIRLREQAQADEKKARTEAAKSRQVAQFLQDMLKGVGPSVALGRDTTMLREILDQTAARVGKELTNQPDVEIEMRLTLAKTYSDLGLYQKEEQMARESLRLARSLPGGENDEVAQSLRQVGLALFNLRNWGEAENTFREALALYRKLHGNENPEVANLLSNLAVAVGNGGNAAEAARLYREALAMSRKLQGNENPVVAHDLLNLAEVLRSLGQLAEAEDLSREGLAMQRKLLGNEHPQVATSLYLLASVLYDRGKLTEAESLLREAVAMNQKLLGNKHPAVAQSLIHLSNVLGRQEKWQEAADCFVELIQREPTNHYYYHNLAPLLVESGDLEKYRSCCKEIIARFGDTTDPYVASRMATDCSILPSSGADPEAVSRMAEVAAAPGPTHRGFAWFQCASALAEYRLGQFGKAVDGADKTIAAIGIHPGDYDWDDTLRVEAYAVAAMARFQLKQTAAAGAVLAQANRLAARLPKLEDGTPGGLDGSWLDWIIAHKLLDEATKLIPVAAVTNADLSDPVVASLVFRPRDFLKQRLAHWDPQDTIGSMQLAFALAWAGPTNEYEAFCRKVLDHAADTKHALTAGRAAKSYLVSPRPDSKLLKQAVALAERSWALGQDTEYRFWYQMCLGLARYREKDYAGALEILAQPVNADEPLIKGPSLMIQAMALQQLGRTDEARKSFQAGEPLMDPPPPAGELRMDMLTQHDTVFFWLLHTEARVLIEPAPAGQ